MDENQYRRFMLLMTLVLVVIALFQLVQSMS